MLARVLDRFDAVTARWPRVFAGVGFAWMMAVAFDHGRLIDLPEVPFLTGPFGIALAGLYNAVWWGVVAPRIDRHRAARAAAPIETKIATHG